MASVCWYISIFSISALQGSFLSAHGQTRLYQAYGHPSLLSRDKRAWQTVFLHPSCWTAHPPPPGLLGGKSHGLTSPSEGEETQISLSELQRRWVAMLAPKDMWDFVDTTREQGGFGLRETGKPFYMDCTTDEWSHQRSFPYQYKTTYLHHTEKKGLLRVIANVWVKNLLL